MRTTLSKQTRLTIQNNQEFKIYLSKLVIDEAMQKLLDDRTKRPVKIGSLLNVSTSKQKIDAFMQTGSSIGTIWKELTAYYSKAPYWLTVNDSYSSSTYRKFHPNPKAVIGFSQSTDLIVLPLVMKYLFNGYMTSPGFHCLPAQRIESLLLSFLYARKDDEDGGQKQQPRL